MKISNIISVFLMVCCSFWVRGQNTTITTCSPVGPPVLLLHGQMVTIACDSVWLLSPHRLQLYEQARQLVMSLNTGNVESLINQYEHKLKLYAYWNDSLRQSYRLLSNRYDSTLTKTAADLTLVSLKLDQANTSIDESGKRIDDAILQIKKSRTEKWLWGLGGILIGLGVASLL